MQIKKFIGAVLTIAVLLNAVLIQSASAARTRFIGLQSLNTNPAATVGLSVSQDVLNSGSSANVAGSNLPIRIMIQNAGTLRTSTREDAAKIAVFECERNDFGNCNRDASGDPIKSSLIERISFAPVDQRRAAGTGAFLNTVISGFFKEMDANGNVVFDPANGKELIFSVMNTKDQIEEEFVGTLFAVDAPPRPSIVDPYPELTARAQTEGFTLSQLSLIMDWVAHHTSYGRHIDRRLNPLGASLVTKADIAGTGEIRTFVQARSPQRGTTRVFNVRPRNGGDVVVNNTNQFGGAGSGFNGRGAWDVAETYAAGDLVRFNNASYTANVAIAAGQDNPSINNDWQLIAQDGSSSGGGGGTPGPAGPPGAPGTPGQNGQDGVGFTSRGAWNSLTAYAVNDVVTFNNSLYIATQASTNSQPDLSPALWTLAVNGNLGGGGVVAPAFDCAGFTNCALIALPANNSTSSFASPQPITNRTTIRLNVSTAQNAQASAILTFDGAGNLTQVQDADGTVTAITAANNPTSLATRFTIAAGFNIDIFIANGVINYVNRGIFGGNPIAKVIRERD